MVLTLQVEPYVALGVVPDGSAAPSQVLADWYCRAYGFSIIQAEPMMLARLPGATPQVGLPKPNLMALAAVHSIKEASK